MVDFKSRLQNKGNSSKPGTSKPGTSKPATSAPTRSPFKGFGGAVSIKSLPKLGAPPLPEGAKPKSKGPSCQHNLLHVDSCKFVDGYTGAYFVAEMTVGESDIHKEGDKVCFGAAFKGAAMGTIKDFLMAASARWPDEISAMVADNPEGDDSWEAVLNWAWGDDQPLSGFLCRSVNSQNCMSESDNVYQRHSFEPVE